MASKKVKNHLDIFDDASEILISSSEFLTSRFYFVVLRTEIKPKYTQNSHYFTIDEELTYDPFFEDFGPLNLALLCRYCTKLNRKLKAYAHLTKKIVHYTTLCPQKRVNAAYLVGSFAVIYLKMSPDEVFLKLTTGKGPPFTDFRDASNGFPVYKISLLDCLHAIYQARKHNFFDFGDFNLEEYEYYETVENGDLNWIVPGKFLAFAGPQSKTHVNERSIAGYPTHTPESYVRYFRENRVTTVVRLNNKLYDAALFTKEGFAHKDLFFFDGSTPSDDLVDKFLQLSEATHGAVAVHCKAGLGRTGSMIACYIMKWYRFSAREAIAWLRICRPASIIGHQQEWLELKQAEMWRLNDKVTAPKHRLGIYSMTSVKDFETVRSAVTAVVRTIRPLPLDNVSRIVNRVDSMSIDNQPRDVNKNTDASPDKDARNAEVLKEQTAITQGDKLNQIKATRTSHLRSLPQRSTRSTWSVAAPVNGTKRVAGGSKLGLGHSRRPLTRSKSSLSPPAKGLCEDTARSTASVVAPAPLQVGMTLRSSNRIYSLRHPRTTDARVCKTTSVR